MVRLTTFSTMVTLVTSLCALALENGVYTISYMQVLQLTLEDSGRFCSLLPESDEDIQKVRFIVRFYEPLLTMSTSGLWKRKQMGTLRSRTWHMQSMPRFKRSKLGDILLGWIPPRILSSSLWMATNFGNLQLQDYLLQLRCLTPS